VGEIWDDLAKSSIKIRITGVKAIRIVIVNLSRMIGLWIFGGKEKTA
jgi:hypothetical protein